MTLLYPAVLLLIPLYLFCQRYCKRELTSRYFSNMPMLLKASGQRVSLLFLLRIAIVMLMILALCAPVLQKQYPLKERNLHAISLLLDASESMREEGRFDTAKSILKDFIQRREGDALSLLLFADDAYLSVPLTTHTEALTQVLSYLQIGVAGRRQTALYEALYLGAGVFEQSKSSERIVILLTDGLNTVQSVPLQTALQKAKTEKLRVYTIGIGDDYQKEILQTIATQTHGKFYEAADPEALTAIYHEIDQLEKSPVITQHYTDNRPLFQYPLLLATLLLLLVLFKYDSGRRTLLVTLLFMLVALYNPTIEKEPITRNKPDKKMMIAIDLSLSMDCSDSYPSRLEVAYNRAKKLIAQLPTIQIGLLGYTNQAFLIMPPTSDHAALLRSLSSIDTSHIDRKGSNPLSAIRATAMLLTHSTQKTLLLFTDGGEQKTFDNEVAFAKEENLTVDIYGIGTAKGGVITYKRDLLKLENGTIVVTRLNPAIKQLASHTGGGFVKHTASNDTLSHIRHRLQEEVSGEDTTDTQSIFQHTALFYLPLFLALLLFASTHIGFRRKR